MKDFPPDTREVGATGRRYLESRTQQTMKIAGVYPHGGLSSKMSYVHVCEVVVVFSPLLRLTGHYIDLFPAL